MPEDHVFAPRHPHRAQRCHGRHLNIIILYITRCTRKTRSALEKQERVSGTWLWLRKWFGDGNAKDHLDFVAMGARPPAQTASWSVRRALLTPQVDPRSLYCRSMSS